jgi:hypothetical protein
MTMELKEAIATAKRHIEEMYEDERVSNVELEEIEHFHGGEHGRWVVTVGFSRPWKSPRTRAQEVLENIGAAPPERRSIKVLTMTEDGTVASLRDRHTAELGNE